MARPRPSSPSRKAEMGVYIATPHTRAFEGAFVDALVQIDGRTSIWKRIENQPIAYARNLLMDDFKKNCKDREFFLSVDSDATFTQAAIDRLVARNAPVICGVFFKRDFPPVPTIGVEVSKNPNGSRNYNFGYTMEKVLNHLPSKDPEYYKTNEVVLSEREGDVVPVDGMGMHFTMIRRDVVEKMKPPYFVDFSVNAGEDFSFCRKAKDLGFKLYCDMSVYIGHIAGPGINLGLKQFLMFMDGVEIDPVWSIGEK